MLAAADQMVALDQPLRQRPADDAAEHQTNGGSGHRQLHARLQVVHLSEALGVGRAGAMAADQGDGAADKAHQRMHVQPPGDQ
ncbi:hypothetical protein D9M71_572300 [compost metagenome]